MPRGVPRAAEPRPCRSCGDRIVLLRNVDDPSKHLVVNEFPQEGGTVVRLNDREGQMVPPGRGPGYTLHSCGRN